MQEIFWKQKSRVDWLLEGDRNTRFFHAMAKEKQRRVNVNRVELDAGHIAEGQADLKAAAVAHFQQIFCTDSCQIDQELLWCIPQTVLQAHNDMLLKIPSLLEVHSAVLSIPKDSAAGPDGFSASFYASSWEVVGQDIHKAISYIFQGEQGAFVQGRSIAENVALAQELFRELNRPVRGGGDIILKLDIDKAYDRVNWDFLKQVLKQFGFSMPWIEMVEKCWAISWFSVLLNGEIEGFFKSSRGLRQGDPISPSLFILSAEVLSRGLKSLLYLRGSRPYALCRECPPITHLLYADDTLIFTNGSKSLLLVIKKFLDSFQASSGQSINLRKCSFYCASKLSSARVSMIESILGFGKSLASFSYLGVPMADGRLQASAFNPIVDRIVGRINGWKARILSQARRAVMVKNVLASIPIHSMAAVHIPSQVGLCNFWKSNWIGLGPLEQLVEVEVLVGLLDDQVRQVIGPCGPLPPSAAFLLLPQRVIDHIFQAGYCTTEGVDVPFWLLTFSGVFSVKSAWSLTRAPRPGRSWSRWVWHAKLPPKISLLLWKVLQNAVPVDSTVQSRGVHLASRCVCCSFPGSQPHDIETLLHLFVNSSIAQVVWQAVGGWFGISVMAASLVEARLSQWWAAVRSRQDKSVNQMIIPCIVIWEIWKARNAAVFDDVPGYKLGSGRSDSTTAGAVLSSAIRKRGRASLIRWERPSTGWVKINVDGSARGNSGRLGGGGICRGEMGNFLFAFSGGYGVGTNTIAELRVVHDGLALGIQRGYSQIILESDSNLVVELLNGVATPGWKWRRWLHRIYQLQGNGRIRFVHVLREGNSPADFLARLGSASQSGAWFDRPSKLPHQVRGSIFLDKVGLGNLRLSISIGDANLHSPPDFRDAQKYISE
ncbi:uncharacterized protein LOC131238937 [Magnolia sinica]|uniref:uncharacterized protein LOC131238937 n=1 Tax=Magnolia sinica TaxID=86752 RepID=UPI00265A6795|nr:uncharacterized protein LOC131238937 [Magnolia sinica]